MAARVLRQPSPKPDLSGLVDSLRRENCHLAAQVQSLKFALINHDANLLPVLLAHQPAVENACVACCVEKADVVMECRHVCVCKKCSPHITACPLCRHPEPPEKRMQLYFS